MLLLIRGVLRHRKNLVKKRTETHFSVFIENRNWDLKFVFWFDNENKKPKKIKILFHFKTKIECPLQPTDYHRYFPNRSNSKRKRKKKRLKNILKLRKHSHQLDTGFLKKAQKLFVIGLTFPVWKKLLEKWRLFWRNIIHRRAYFRACSIHWVAVNGKLAIH